ncbi:lipopolysaccharide biosynthesis protein [Halomonas sp. MCCC 1A17488]|uniref:Lipopolysaccharide biosynthesis protein n=1 Tax=Billgrantia sulfidoxydans TaxID=2733484 RepID=A0ABX7W4I6_9GAMM|nr:MULTISPECIES: lipopolysaccharide biosynthesis protein [Halomonas]MCE8015056.1 lipopolysaccharide biosynthesis protein [Halomonas sp. MCCC 1A17488]MCG3238389.1 lipopolysaccharide biosynthesis protein [Halomonas sp. MCCC 1A17488]QPP47868.1 lipopolysaccharide biosynthesis protein [Halomonas sp. SS10-MC5]QTP55171.1 lipopolysaccharide biosynthesis protein [Halomonas sulfidoxydans]
MLNRLVIPARRLLPTHAFARGVSVLVGGTAGAQLLTIAAAPLLTRLYAPEDFGLLAVYGGLLALFTVVASGRYQLAIPLPETEREAAEVLALSLTVVAVTTLVALLLVLLGGRALATALGVPSLSAWLWLLPLGVAAAGGYQAVSHWAVRTRAFAALASTRIKQSLALLAIQLVASPLGGGGLLLGHAAGQGAGTLALARPALRAVGEQQVTAAGMWAAACRYRKFPLLSSWSGLFNTLGKQLPPLLFAALFSPVAAGLYALAHRVLAMPMTLIGEAVGKVFFASAAEAHRQGELGPLVAKVHATLAQLAMPPVLVLMAIGPELFALVFGERWREAGEFARWMAPWLYLVFITSPLSHLFSVLERQGQGLIFQALLLGVRVAAIAIGAARDDLLLTVALFSLGSAACWIGFLVWIARLTDNPPRVLATATLTALGWGLVLLAPLLAAGWLAPAWLPWSVALLLCAALVGLRYFLLFRRAYQ